MIEQKNGQQVFEYKFPDFLADNNGEDSTNSNDYEILQVLGSGAFSCVLKVKSKINNQIYAMKKIDIFKIINEKNLNKKYFENETFILQSLNSPYVCKCYKIFQEGNFLFFLMEFMNNKDLDTFYKANKALEKQIPEEQLWDIFYKCISGLKYIHKKGLIHRDIKLENLFLDDDFNIKIGDFNVSATVDKRSAENFADEEEDFDNLENTGTVVGTKGYMAPEVKRNEYMKSSYGTKADVFSMGVSFFELCYGCKPYENNIEKESFYNKNLYSKELNDIVDLMIERNDRKRPYSEDVYNDIRKNFIKKCVKNSSVDAAIHCFFCYENFKSFFNNNKNKILINQISNNEEEEMNIEQINHKLEIGNSTFNAIQSLNSNDKDKKDDYLYELRKNMINAGLNAKDNEEIEPGILISFFLRILNSVINEITEVDEKSFNEDIAILSSIFKFQQGQEEEMFNRYINAYSKKLLSLISKNFFNMIKVRKECQDCHQVGYSYTMLHFIPFNIKLLTRKYNKKDNWHIKDGFKYLLNDNITLNKSKGIKCRRCNDYTIHNESKNFYHTAKNLIIVFDRGENFSNKEFINFDEQLILNKEEVERYFEVRYKLVAILQKKENSKENGEYEAYMNYGNNNWASNKNKQKTISLDEVKKNGITCALFYYSEDNNLILQPNYNQKSNYPNNNMINNNGQGMPNYFHGMPFPNNNNMGINYNNYNNSNMNNMNIRQNNINMGHMNQGFNMNQGNNMNMGQNQGMNNMNIGQSNMNQGFNNMNMGQIQGMNNINRSQNNMNIGQNSMNQGMNNLAGGMNNNNLSRMRSNNYNNFQMNTFRNNNF